MGWDTSSDFETSSLGSNGLVFKSVMVKTRKEKGKESELHVRTVHMSLLILILLEIRKCVHNFIMKRLRFQKHLPKFECLFNIAFKDNGLILHSGCQRYSEHRNSSIQFENTIRSEHCHTI